MNSTVSSAQAGKQSQDSTKCYTYQELQYISASLTELHACDSLLSIRTARLANRDSLVTEKAFEITKLEDQHELKDKIIVLKDEKIQEVNGLLEKEVTRHKWTKLGWASTTVALGGTILYLIFR